MPIVQNAGFEQGTFANWDWRNRNCHRWTTVRRPYPMYTQTGTAIVSPDGIMISIVDPE